MSTNFFEHSTIPQNSQISPVESLASEVSEAFERLSVILNTSNAIPSFSTILGNYILLDVNYHGVEEDYTDSFSVGQSTKDLVLTAEPVTITSVSYLNTSTNTEITLTQKLPSQAFTGKEEYKVIGKVVHLSTDLSNITVKVKYRGLRRLFGNLKLKPNVIKNTNNTYLLPLTNTVGSTYEVTYDQAISTQLEKLFNSTVLDSTNLFLLIKDGDEFKNIPYTSVVVTGSTVRFELDQPLTDDYSAVVYASNVTIAEFLTAFYKEFINHNHSKTASEKLISHANLTDLYKNTSAIFYKDIGITNYEHPQYLNREGYNPALTSVYENALLGDLFIASKITEFDQSYKSLLKNSNSILFGDPVSGSKLYFDSDKKAIVLLSGNNLNGLDIEIGTTNKAISINNTSYIKESETTLQIHGKNDVVEIVPLNGTGTSVLKSDEVRANDKVITPSLKTGELEVGNVLVNAVGDNIEIQVVDATKNTKFISSVTMDIEDLNADNFNAHTITLKDGDRIEVDEKTFITKKTKGINIVSEDNTAITSSGRRTGLTVGSQDDLSVNIYTADYLGQQSSSIDTGAYIETPPQTETYFLQSTDSEINYGENNYKFGETKAGFITISSLKEWRRSNINAGNANFYSATLKASDGVKKNGLIIGTTKISAIGQGLDCPAGMTLVESADTVSIIKPLPDNQVECNSVSYQSLNAGDTQIFGKISVDDSLYAVENITAGEALIGRSLSITEDAVLKTVSVQGESNFTGRVEFNGAVDILNRVNITGSTNIEGSLDSVNITTENFASIGGSLNVKGQTILENNVIVEGQISTSGGFTTIGPITSDSLKTGRIESQAIYSVGGLTAEGQIQLTGPIKADGNLALNGNCIVQGSFEATSEVTADSLYVTGSTVIGERLTVQGSVILEGQSIALGQAGSTITIAGNLQLDAPTTTMTGDVRVFKQLDVSGNIVSAGSITTSNILTATSLKINSDATVSGLLKADSGEFNRKVFFIDGLKTSGDSDFTRVRATEINSNDITTTNVFINETLTMGPESTVKTENLITGSFSQTSSSEDVLFAGPTQFLSTMKAASKIIVGNEAIENGRNTSGVLITDRELTMGNNSIIKATKIFATKGLPIGSNQDKNAGFCFEAASNNGGTDGDTGFFATTGQGSGIDGSDLEFWIDGARRGVISKNDVAYNADANYNKHLVTIDMLKNAVADLTAQVSQMNQAVGDRFWPVNSIYITMDARNPYDIMGFGTWLKFAPGRTLVGSVNDTIPGGQITGGLEAPAGFDVRTAGSSYGSYTHSLTSVENGPHYHGYVQDDSVGEFAERYPDLSQIYWDVAHTKNNAYGPSRYKTTTEGKGLPHNNVQPSIVTNMWLRVQ